MKNFSPSLQRLAHFLISMTLIVYILIKGQSILVPIAFAALFALMLKPVSNFFERLFSNRVAAIFITFLVALLPVFFLITFFSFQIVTVLGDLSGLMDQLQMGIETIVLWSGENLGLDADQIQEWLTNNFAAVLETPLNFITSSLSSSTVMMTSMLICAIYTFFFLLYRTAFKNFLLTQFDQESRTKARSMIHQAQDLSQRYFYGLLLVMLILGVLNSLGLWLIGIQYPFFWGFLGAVLAIVPYIGTTLGGTFPFIFSLMTTHTWWQPLAVVLLYITIQSIEGNFITPKVVGSSVKINPLAAIIALIIGGALWGIAGLVLALPIVATLRTMFSYFDILKPISELMSVNIFENADAFEKKYDEDRYRLISFFQRNQR
ncbi:MAG: AI-2E family transporter [Saprospiraceae bacterium]|nr:AI-2E family transporter [Lewinella sp.]